MMDRGKIDHLVRSGGILQVGRTRMLLAIVDGLFFRWLYVSSFGENQLSGCFLWVFVKEVCLIVCTPLCWQETPDAVGHLV